MTFLCLRTLHQKQEPPIKKYFLSNRPGVGNLRPAGRIRPFTSFSNDTARLVKVYFILLICPSCNYLALSGVYLFIVVYLAKGCIKVLGSFSFVIEMYDISQFLIVSLFNI